MNQSEFLAITCNLLGKARQKSHVEGAVDFPSYWLKNWREIFKPMTKHRNREIALDRHLKNALYFYRAITRGHNP